MRDKYKSLIVHELRTPTLSIISGTDAALIRLQNVSFKNIEMI